MLSVSTRTPPPEEALAYFARKYADLEGQVKIAEQRVQRGASANDVARTVEHLTALVAEAARRR